MAAGLVVIDFIYIFALFIYKIYTHGNLGHYEANG